MLSLEKTEINSHDRALPELTPKKAGESFPGHVVESNENSVDDRSRAETDADRLKCICGRGRVRWARDLSRPFEVTSTYILYSFRVHTRPRIPFVLISACDRLDVDEWLEIDSPCRSRE
jgi:hypothetical protein